jgi:hypothetical protein
MKQLPSLLQKILTGFVIFAGLGLLGALPAGFLGLLAGTQVAGDVYLLATLLISSWFPLKVLIDAYVKKQEPMWSIPPGSNLFSLIILVFGFIVMIPFLYMMTFTAFLAGMLAYLITGNSLILALVAALTIQSFSIYQTAQKEKEMGISNNLFVRFQDMNMSMNYDISIDTESSRVAQEPYNDRPVLLLPAERLREVDDDFDDDFDDEQMTITIDSDDTESEEDGVH